MHRDFEFWVRLVAGVFGLIFGAWVVATSSPGYYLRVPAAVIAVASLYVLAGVFIPAIRWPRR